jgi:tetratricopeptide (TPR) repeat protein
MLAFLREVADPAAARDPGNDVSHRTPFPPRLPVRRLLLLLVLAFCRPSAAGPPPEDPRAAVDAARTALERDPQDDAALARLAAASVTLNDAAALEDAADRLRRRVAALSPERAKDAVEPVPTLLFWLGRVSQVASRHDDGRAPALQEDALTALRRARDGGKASVECLVLEARMLEEVRGAEEALTALDAALLVRPDDPALLGTRGDVRYRSVWQQTELTDAARAALQGAVADYVKVDHARRSDESALFLAYAYHRLGDVDRAVDAYVFAAKREGAATKALGGLRNLLAKDLPRFRSTLETHRKVMPDSPALLLFTAYEALQLGKIEDAERDLWRRRDLEPRATAATRYYLAQAAAKRGDRRAATDHYAVALALEPKFPRLVAEYEAYIQSRELKDFPDADALVADFRQMIAAGPDEPRFQTLLRNDLAFALREFAARHAPPDDMDRQDFAAAPEKAKDALRLCIAMYEEAVSHIPQDAADLSFRARWEYAAVLNDAGLMHQYVKPVQDFARAEALYDRAFALSQGGFQDTYFPNYQRLYGEYWPGHDDKWRDVARVAMDAILKVDPASESGFSPDEEKRAAARADFERLSAKLGK